MSESRPAVRRAAVMMAGAGVALAALAATAAGAPTNSSPITLSPDEKLVYVVNPGADSLSVLRADTSRVVRTIRVGDEPQGVAVAAGGRQVYVANAAAGTVTVLRVLNATPARFRAVVDRGAGRRGVIVTGAEPWNIVASPDGRRVYVANSGQDTITVIDAVRRRVIGNVNLKTSLCNAPDRTRHFQPRGLAVTNNNRGLYVTRFLSFTRPGGRQADDLGKEGAVCRLDVSSTATRIGAYRPRALVRLAPRVTGFKIDANGDGTADDTSAFPNQLQSVVIWRNQAYLPSIAASPTGPLRFNVDTQAFVSVVDGANGVRPFDASGAKFLNLHLGARNPEQGKKRIFFANPWAMAVALGRGQGPIYGAGRGDAAYVVASGSDVLVKVNVARDGVLSFTEDGDTTRYIDLNDPANPATSGANAGKNPRGIVINRRGTRAWVMNFVSHNVSVVNLLTDSVIGTVRTSPLPPSGSQAEVVLVGAEMFFSSRGHFDRPAGTTVSTEDRLSSEGWQSCSSCHFQGLTDGVVWAFGSGPRKSVPLNSTFNPNNPDQQRVLNYSAIFDEVEDFEANIRNVSGPGNLATGALDPNHGLIFGATINDAPAAVPSLIPIANAGRPQHTVTLPGGQAVPALTALKEWVRFAVRTPSGPTQAPRVAGGPTRAQVAAGRRLFTQAGCQACHGGELWTSSVKNFTSPPAAGEVFTERTPPPVTGNPVATQFLNAFLRDIGSFNLGVAGGPNPIGRNVGGVEKASAVVVNGVLTAQDGLGIDYNNDGKGVGFNVPSLLGIGAVPPYYHNGACETLDCVLTDRNHRTAKGTRPDVLVSARARAQVVAFLQSIQKNTPAP